MVSKGTECYEGIGGDNRIFELNGQCCYLCENTNKRLTLPTEPVAKRVDQTRHSRRATRVRLRFRPLLDQLRADLARGDHFIEARPLEWRVNIVLTRREIRGRQSFLGQLRSIGAASDDR